MAKKTPRTTNPAKSRPAKGPVKRAGRTAAKTPGKKSQSLPARDGDRDGMTGDGRYPGRTR